MPDLSTFETFVPPMRAISLWQPWSSLVAERIKWVETRPKQHPWRSAIGQTIAIHAAIRKPEMMTLGDWHCDPRYRPEPMIPGEPRIWRSLTKPGDLFGSHESRPLPLGAVIATCRITGVVPMLGDCGTDMGQPTHICGTAGDTYLLLHRPDWDPLDGETEFDVSDQRPFGDFAPGRWAILLDQIVKLAEPIPCRGHQGLWSLLADVEEQITAQRATGVPGGEEPSTTGGSR